MARFRTPHPSNIERSGPPPLAAESAGHTGDAIGTGERVDPPFVDRDPVKRRLRIVGLPSDGTAVGRTCEEDTRRSAPRRTEVGTVFTREQDRRAVDGGSTTEGQLLESTNQLTRPRECVNPPHPRHPVARIWDVDAGSAVRWAGIVGRVGIGDEPGAEHVQRLRVDVTGGWALGNRPVRRQGRFDTVRDHCTPIASSERRRTVVMSVRMPMYVMANDADG